MGVTLQHSPDRVVTRELIHEIKEKGFDSIRMPLTLFCRYTEENGRAVIDTQWLARYAEPVSWCCANEIASGRSSQAFEPNAAITREKAANFLYRYARYQKMETPTGDLTSFPDSKDVSPDKDSMVTS